ncbi:MAG: hypothetical protein COU27_02775, partial [Candidatus Levybacteria bacterium CG10_big_fil_rev_8_21_14_0_10_36_7]
MDLISINDIVARLLFLGGVVLAATFASFLTIGFVYLLVVYIRLKKRDQMAYEMTTLEIQMTKDNEIKIDAAEQMFASFSSIKKPSGWFSFLEVGDILSFEIVGTKSEIRFYVSAPSKIIDLIEKTIYGYYPNADIKHVEEPNIFTEKGSVAFAALRQEKDPHFPLKTFRELPTD